MKLHLSIAVLIATSALAACQPAAEWTESEAPKRIGLDTAPSRIDLRFAPGSDRLAPADAKRLHDLAASGAIAPSDRVTVSGGGGPRLAEARAAAVSTELLRYGIVTSGSSLTAVPNDRAIVAVDRTLVTLPPCPNWSKPPGSDFTNSLGSYYGCTTAVNLGRMVAYPTDLASGQPQGMPDGTPAAAAVKRYLTDKVTLPAAANVGPIASTSSAAPGAAGGGASGGAAGSQ
jgi:pilus assembly protein CpaD